MENIEKKSCGGEVVSVVVPVRDRAHIVERTLESIENQSYRPLHLIIVDNGSRDETLRVVSDWKAAHETADLKVTVLLESTPGASVARNRGLREVTSDKMMFFDSDDVMRPGLISKAMAVFASDPELQLVCWKVVRKDLHGGEREGHITRGNILECHMVHAMLCTIVYMVRTGYIKKAGSWNETLSGWDDWELGVRLMLPSPKVEVIDEVLAEANVTKESITGETFTQKQGEWERSIRQVEADIDRSDRKDKDRLKRIALYRRAILAAHYRREKNPDAAAELLGSALESPLLSPIQRGAMRIAYAYTARGGRGAFIAMSRIL